MRQDAAKKAANSAIKSRIHSSVKKAVAAAATENQDEAIRAAVSVIDSAAQKGVIHKNAAARKKSRLNANVQAAVAKIQAEKAKLAEEEAKEEAKEAYKEAMEERLNSFPKKNRSDGAAVFLLPEIDTVHEKRTVTK